MTVKSITLNGSEVTVGILTGSNAHIRNDGAQVIYAAKKPGITPGAEGVLPIPPGNSAALYGISGRVYLLGSGSAAVVSSDYAASPFKSTVTSGSVTGEVARAASNPNLLINPDFRINQCAVTGTITDSGYFVDRWKLVSGSVTVNADGTLTLNGSISQTLENAAGTDVAASSSAGTAVYDNSTKTFTLSASGETVSWAKLEVGGIATRFSPPDPAAELLKCQRYLWVLRGNLLRSGIALAPNENYALFFLYAPTAFRTTPTVSYENLVLAQSENGNLTNEIKLLQIKGYTSNVVKLYVQADTASPLTAGALYELTNMSGAAGSLIFNAEI